LEISGNSSAVIGQKKMWEGKVGRAEALHLDKELQW